MKECREFRVVQCGLGPIGLECCRRLLKKEGMRLVGAIDIDPQKTGMDIGDLIGLGAKTGITVGSDTEKVIQETKPDVALHTTVSSFEKVYPQLEQIAGQGVDIVSSTEELLYPWLRNKQLADKLDAFARRHKATILGTGVNPGFVMDTLALTATAVCAEVSSVKVERFVDAGKRRLPLQQKVGAGITVAEFNCRKQNKAIGHVGMLESVTLIAHGLGWELDDLQESLEPIVAEEDIRTPFLEVKRGQVAGIWDTGRGFSGGKELISLDLRMYVGCKEPRDRVTLDSQPPIELEIKGGVFGDLATVAMLMNMAPCVVTAESGLKTMIDLPLPCWCR